MELFCPRYCKTVTLGQNLNERNYIKDYTSNADVYDSDAEIHFNSWVFMIISEKEF